LQADHELQKSYRPPVRNLKHREDTSTRHDPSHWEPPRRRGRGRGRARGRGGRGGRGGSQSTTVTTASQSITSIALPQAFAPAPSQQFKPIKGFRDSSFLAS
jgi:hypothetical protein